MEDDDGMSEPSLPLRDLGDWLYTTTRLTLLPSPAHPSALPCPCDSKVPHHSVELFTMGHILDGVAEESRD